MRSERQRVYLHEPVGQLGPESYDTLFIDTCAIGPTLRTCAGNATCARDSWNQVAKFYAPQTIERVAQKWNEETAELAERVARGRVRVPVEQHGELKNHIQRLLARKPNPALYVEYERTMLLLSARTHFSSRTNNSVYEATLQHNLRQVKSKQTSRADRALFAAACAHAIEHPSVTVHMYTRDSGLVQLFEDHVRILRCTHLPLETITERVYIHTALGVQRKILASDGKAA